MVLDLSNASMLFCIFLYSATVTNLQQKLEGLTTTNALMKEDLAIAKNNILQLQQENSELRTENEALSEQIKKQLAVSIPGLSCWWSEGRQPVQRIACAFD